MSKLVDWWLQYLEIKDLTLVNTPCDYNCTYLTHKPDSYESIAQYLRSEMLGSENSLDDFHLYLGKTATELIDTLFDAYVDKDTLVITSVVEHEAVEKNLDRLNLRGASNHISMHYVNGIRTLNLSQVKFALMQHKYKRVFAYIIGTQITTGEVTPQKFYDKLRKYCESQGLETIIVIDDVHGLYFVPRDYSNFDYIIGTAHALVRRFDMGMVWSKREGFGCQNENWIRQYRDRLVPLLQRRDKLAQFSNVMKEEFIEYLGLPMIEYISDSVPHIFSIKVSVPPRYIYTQEEWKDLADVEVRLETKNYETDNIFYIRMRGAQYLTLPSILYPAIEKTRMILDRVVEYGDF